MSNYDALVHRLKTNPAYDRDYEAATAIEELQAKVDNLQVEYNALLSDQIVSVNNNNLLRQQLEACAAALPALWRAYQEHLPGKAVGSSNGE